MSIHPSLKEDQQPRQRKRSHPGQMRASARKKRNKVMNERELEREAARLKITVPELRRRRSLQSQAQQSTPSSRGWASGGMAAAANPTFQRPTYLSHRDRHRDPWSTFPY